MTGNVHRFSTTSTRGLSSSTRFWSSRAVIHRIAIRPKCEGDHGGMSWCNREAGPSKDSSSKLRQWQQGYAPHP
jgi:hypothetical protein